MSVALEERLTLLSGYRWLVPSGEKGSDANPVAYAHWRLTLGNRAFSVLSRVCDAGFDYSGRSNRFAHHVVVDSSEQSTAGPAWVMLNGGIFRERWEGQPVVFEAGPQIPDGPNSPHVCSRWKELANDAGWAGVLAGTSALDPSLVSYVIYAPGTQVLPLINEAMALLPATMRWQITFSTYFTDLPAGLSCAWRFCAAGTKAAIEAKRYATSGIILDLTGPFASAPDTQYTTAARTGTAPASYLDSGRKVREDIELIPISPAIPVERPVDQSWMPPMGTTIVEGAAAARPDAGTDSGRTDSIGDMAHRNLHHPRAAFWAIALLWPLFVGGGIWLRLKAPSAQPLATRPSPTTHETTSTEPTVESADIALRALQKATNEKYTDAVRTATEIKLELDRANEELEQLRPRAMKFQEAENQLLLKDSQIRTLKAALPATKPATSQPSQSSGRGVEALADEVELWRVDGNISSGDDFKFVQAYDPPPGLTYEQFSKRWAMFEVPQTATATSADAKAPRTELAYIKFDENRAVLVWVNKPGFMKLQGAESWLRMSEVQRLRDKEAVMSVSLTRHRTLTWNVRKPPSDPIVVPKVLSGEALNLIALKSRTPAQGGWKIESNGAHTLTVTNADVPRAHFDVQLNTQHRAAVDVGWEREEKNESEALKAATANMAKASQEQKNRTSEIKDFQAQLQRESAEAKRNDLEKNISDATKGRDDALAKEREHEAEKHHAEAALAALHELPPIDVQVINVKTGTVLCTVKITR